MEQVVQLVKAYEVGKPDALVVVVPKSLRDSRGIRKGPKFLVKIDEAGRLIYEPIQDSYDGHSTRIQAMAMENSHGRCQ